MVFDERGGCLFPEEPKSSQKSTVRARKFPEKNAKPGREPDRRVVIVFVIVIG